MWLLSKLQCLRLIVNSLPKQMLVFLINLTIPDVIVSLSLRNKSVNNIIIEQSLHKETCIIYNSD